MKEILMESYLRIDSDICGTDCIEECINLKNFIIKNFGEQFKCNCELSLIRYLEVKHGDNKYRGGTKTHEKFNQCLEFYKNFINSIEWKWKEETKNVK